MTRAIRGGFPSTSTDTLAVAGLGWVIGIASRSFVRPLGIPLTATAAPAGPLTVRTASLYPIE